jgi:hypothetical protein
MVLLAIANLGNNLGALPNSLDEVVSDPLEVLQQSIILTCLFVTLLGTQC